MSNMKKDKKAETKRGPPHTGGEAHDRVTAETVVTEGPSGMERMRRILKIISSPPSRREPSS